MLIDMSLETTIGYRIINSRSVKLIPVEDLARALDISVEKLIAMVEIIEQIEEEVSDE